MTARATAAVSRFDRAVDRSFDRLRSHRRIDRVMYALSEVGDFSLIWHTVGAAVALCGDERAERGAVRLSAALAVEAVLVNGVVKSAFGRQRPQRDVPHTHRLRRPRTSSFPSGHASAAACAAVILADQTGRWLPWTALAALVASSRVHVRIHHGSDVIGGAIIGAGLGLSVVRIAPLP